MIQISKCGLYREVAYWGQIINEKGAKTRPGKIATGSEFPVPTYASVWDMRDVITASSIISHKFQNDSSPFCKMKQYFVGCLKIRTIHLLCEFHKWQNSTVWQSKRVTRNYIRRKTFSALHVYKFNIATDNRSLVWMKMFNLPHS